MNPGLKIGHETNQIQTVLTEVYPCMDEDMCFADSAIFKATGSGLLDLVNIIVVREIMLRAMSVKFALPITVNQVEEQSCPIIVQSLSQLRKFLKGPDFNTLLDSVQPIITKVKPSEENFDIECKQSEVAEKLGMALEKLKIQVKRESEGRRPPEIEEMNLYFDQLEQFFKHFPWKFETIDPLGRIIPDGEEQSQALNEAELKQKFKFLAPVDMRVVDFSIASDN